VYRRQYIECQANCPVSTANNPAIDNNFISDAFYLDIGGSHNIKDNVTACFQMATCSTSHRHPKPAMTMAPTGVR
jgi:iron complex outermembrane receptor protein